MGKTHFKSGFGVGLVALAPAALAATQEEMLELITKSMLYIFIAFVLIAIVGVYFMKSRDKRRDPLGKLFEEGEAIHSIAPSTLVAECVRLMTANRIGALVVMDGRSLRGIFTERDALNKVLAAGLDPARTAVSEVMTKDPYCVPPTMSVGQAMELITKRRFRHLPVTENGKLLAVVSSGDLTRWVIQDRVREFPELAALSET